MLTMGYFQLSVVIGTFFSFSAHAFEIPAPVGQVPLRHPQASALSAHSSQEVDADDLADKNGLPATLPPYAGIDDDFANFKPPIFPKTIQDDKFLKSTLLTNFMFRNLPESSLNEIAQAFERTEFQAGQTIIRQGDANAEYFYALVEGDCTVKIDGKVLPEPYGTMKPGSTFGDLALLYDALRAATVTAKTQVTLFRIDRRSFLYFLDHTQANGDTEDVKQELRKIDVAIDRVAGVKTRYGGDIIQQFNPRRFWLWRRWSGTILQHAWKDAAMNMLLSMATIALVRRYVPNTWAVGLAPDASHPIIARLNIFGKLWHYLMSLTTFILTFFVSQAYSLWREIYNAARGIQGRLNDINILVAVSAKRDERGSYTPEAEATVDDVAASSRLFHAFLWASFAKNLSILLTPRGLSRMLSRGLMTQKQYNILQNQTVGASNVCLEWIIFRAIRGTEDGSLRNDDALRHELYGKICTLRGTAAGVGDTLDGRMPLAYAHFVQVLVDTFLLTAPLALYAELGAWSVLCGGILTLFYSGLLGLAKVFLDPLHNDDFYKESINMDIGVLVREGNAGSTRWKNGASVLPF